ncbi:biotin/lipoyl-containing protein [Dactylosporangium sp. CA-092794]|uniref:biotin/lipoyl-containing protein n=1 Tax=Dactylosporangium sp. CA-092794 TaxID=3239929 RepID=UPI003D94ABE8
MAEEVRAEMVCRLADLGAFRCSPLVILESMKMEIPVVAGSGGTISQIAVNEGDVVRETPTLTSPPETAAPPAAEDLIAVIG